MVYVVCLLNLLSIQLGATMVNITTPPPERDTPKRKRKRSTKEPKEPQDPQDTPDTIDEKDEHWCGVCNHFINKLGHMDMHLQSCKTRKEKEEAKKARFRKQIAEARVCDVQPLSSTSTNRTATPILLIERGLARKHHRKLSKRFTVEQKEYMTMWFEEGEVGKRVTTKEAHHWMLDMWGEDGSLTPEQISSWWATYKRKRTQRLADMFQQEQAEVQQHVL